MLKHLAIMLTVLGAVGCATTAQEQQDNAARADQLFGKAKVGLVIATVAVGGYNIVCKGNLSTSPICAANISEIVNRALKAAADAIASAERIFAASNSTLDQKMAAVNIATALVTELTNIVANYVPASAR